MSKGWLTISENLQGILLPSHGALHWQQPLLSRPEGWRRMSWDRLPAGSTAFEPAPFVSVFLSQVKDASWKTQASCDNTLSNLYSTKPFRAGKVNWGSNWLIRCLALSTASVQTQHGETQPGAARSCRAAPCTEAGHSRHQARNGLLSYPTQSMFSVWKQSDKKQAGSQGQAPPSAAWSHSPWGSAFQTAASPSSQSSRLAGRLPSISL